MPQQKMPRFPLTDSGFFHLTAHGWLRQDKHPFPKDRIETWEYEMERPAEDAKEQVRLARIWTSAGMPAARRDEIYAKFGDAVAATPERHVTLDCRA
ncbi:MAG TPA: hypothetical protein VG867_08400 [Rhizomicrobium sp.]|nr:hypothetical protein [Rhizomicrobium sp.]